MSKEKILVIEDDEDIQELIRYTLSREGYQVFAATDGEAGLKKVEATLPDLVLLDLMLPGMDGLEICKAIRSGVKTQTIPVIMLTAKGEEADMVAGLEVGADDYMAKPFSPRILLARIRTVLRRRKREDAGEEAPVKIGEFLIHPGRHEVLVRGKPVELTFTEFRILHFLARHPGWVFSRYQIVDAIRGENYVVTDRAVDVQIVGLRKKLGNFGEYIETVRGVGYRFKEPS